MNIFIDILIILVFNVIILFLFSLLKIPQIISLIFTGFLIGPSGLKLVHSYEEIELIAEIGIILLLFTIGLEFSIQTLKESKRDIFILGTLQILFTILIIFSFSLYFFDWKMSLFIGMIVSLSSTAIVLKILQEQNQVHSPYGKICISILIFQDLIAIAFVLMIPIFDRTNAQTIFTTKDILILISKLITALIIFWLLLKFLIPLFLNAIARLRNRDLFILTVMVLCFLIAFGTYKAGLSLALGAFLAGLIISETPFSHESMSNVIPFKVIFSSIFFSSIGMLVDLEFFIKNYNWVKILIITFWIIVIKFIIISFLVFIFHRNIRLTILTGLSLFQIGEFSFILLKAGFQTQMITNEIYQILLSVSIISMLITPITIKISETLSFQISDIVIKWSQKHISWSGKLLYKTQNQKVSSTIEGFKDHIIIIGYGINGKNVAQAALIVDIPYVIVEMNPKTVQKESQRGEPIIYGDASHPHILEHVNIQKAKMIVIVINDRSATRRIISLAKKMNPDIFILARTRYILEVPELLKVGANEVIPEEFETSIQIFRKILEHYNFNLHEIQFFSEELRISGYDILRRMHSHPEKQENRK